MCAERVCAKEGVRRRAAKLLTVIGLTTMHAVYRITSMLYPMFYISKNDFTKLSAKIIASI